MGYWIWYVLVALSAWAFKLPALALLAIFVAFGRRVLPDPVEWVRVSGQIRELRDRVASYPGDLLARRNLARLYLARRSPRRAAALLEEAIAKGLRDPEAFYLLGEARLRAGEPDAALAPIVKSVAEDDRLMMGEAYFTAGEALRRTGKFEEAEDALQRGLALNSSRVDGHVKLGLVRAAKRDFAGARKAYEAAVDTWRRLPTYMRRHTFAQYLVARWRLVRAKKA